MPLIGSQWFMTRTGDCATNSLETGGFIRSKEGVPHPDIQLHFLPFAVKDHGRVFPDGHAYQVSMFGSFSVSTVSRNSLCKKVILRRSIKITMGTFFTVIETP